MLYTLTYSSNLNKIVMEEMMKRQGLTRVSSSELINVRGGSKAKRLIALLKRLGKHLPDFLEGLLDGLKTFTDG